MTKIYRRPRSLAAACAGPPASLAAMIMLVAAIAHKLGLLQTYPFLWSLAVAAVFAVFSAILAVRGLVSLWQIGAEGGRRSAFSLILSIAVLAPFADAGLRFVTLPPIVQVSTDLSDPPQLSSAGRAGNAFANPVTPIDSQTAQEQAQYYPEIVGRRYALSPERVGDIVGGLLRSSKWQMVTRAGSGTPQDPIVITGVARTLIFAIPADISIRITDDGETTVVDMCSAIRFGPHDLGLDRDFVTGFLDELDAAVVAQ